MFETIFRKLSRMELIYTCIAKMVMYVYKIDDSDLSDDLKSNDFNRLICHQCRTTADERMKQLLIKDADKLFALYDWLQ